MRTETQNKNHIDGIIGRIQQLNTGLQPSDLAYLRTASWIGEWHVSVKYDDAETRAEALYKMCLPASKTGLLPGTHFLIIIYTDTTGPLLMKELPTIGKIVELFQPYGEVTFDFGMLEGHGDNIDIDIIASKQ